MQKKIKWCEYITTETNMVAKIRNPKTGRMVLASGKIGKEIVTSKRRSLKRSSIKTDKTAFVIVEYTMGNVDFPANAYAVRLPSKWRWSGSGTNISKNIGPNEYRHDQQWSGPAEYLQKAKKVLKERMERLKIRGSLKKYRIKTGTY